MGYIKNFDNNFCSLFILYKFSNQLKCFLAKTTQKLANWFKAALRLRCGLKWRLNYELTNDDRLYFP